jgi:nucleotide-binding universal stress UspA family protein
VARAFKYYDNIYVPPVSISEFEDKIVKGAQRRLDEFVKEFLDDCPISKQKILPGDPSEEIVQYVEDEGIDLVVMGTHGRKRVNRVLFGSVATYVVQMSRAPVMTVNPFRLGLLE